MEALSRNWGWLLALGILMIVLGAVASAAPVVATIAVQFMLGWLLVIIGIAEGIHAFMVQGRRGFLLELLSAILYLGVGILLLVNPLEGALALTIVLAVFLSVEGIFKIIMALRVRDHGGWGWLLASGIVSLILGVLIWAQWPASGLWLIGLLVGIQLLFTGWSWSCSRSRRGRVVGPWPRPDGATRRSRPGRIADDIRRAPAGARLEADCGVSVRKPRGL